MLCTAINDPLLECQTAPPLRERSIVTAPQAATTATIHSYAQTPDDYASARRLGPTCRSKDIVFSGSGQHLLLTLLLHGNPSGFGFVSFKALSMTH